MHSLQETTISKISWRLLPLLMVSYFVAYLDRVNLGFAGSAMSKDLGFTSTVFGSAAGIFFLAYFLFEVPATWRWSASAPAAGSPASCSPGA